MRKAKLTPVVIGKNVQKWHYDGLRNSFKVTKTNSGCTVSHSLGDKTRYKSFPTVTAALAYCDRMGN